MLHTLDTWTYTQTTQHANIHTTTHHTNTHITHTCHNSTTHTHHTLTPIPHPHIHTPHTHIHHTHTCVHFKMYFYVPMLLSLKNYIPQKLPLFPCFYRFPLFTAVYKICHEGCPPKDLLKMITVDNQPWVVKRKKIKDKSIYNVWLPCQFEGDCELRMVRTFKLGSICDLALI